MSEPSKPVIFNRTITSGVLFALCVQTAGGLIWVGAAQARLQAVEIQMTHYAPSLERLALLEGQMLMIRESLSRIEKQVTANAIEAERRP